MCYAAHAGHPAGASNAVTGVNAATAIDPATEALGADQTRTIIKTSAKPIQLQVIEAIGGGERCVCELTEQLDLAQSKPSFHLRVLKEAGLLADLSAHLRNSAVENHEHL